MPKQKILLLADDLRMNSGIATMSRELVLSTVHRFDWVQLAGAINHPEKGKVFDLSQSANEAKKITDAYIKLYPCDGYGNEQLLFQVIAMERPNAILHFTDPRFWGWLYAVEKAIRLAGMPITYLNIWDDLPYPMYNRPYYESCDALFSISKQTYNLNEQVMEKKNCVTVKDEGSMDGKTLLHYVPHGIDEVTFRPLAKDDPKLIDFRKRLLQGRDSNFVLLYNSRNVHRKRTSNILMAYRQFCDNLSKEEAAKCTLVMHTEIIQNEGTNLLAVKEALCPDYHVIFSPGKLSPEDMNLLYNACDVTVNASSSEGFGLSIAESIMSGTPVICTVTGGLQDQIGQTDDDGKPVEFTADFGSNNVGKYRKHGPWAYPVFPVTRLIQGSPPTPYIFDDLAKWEDFAEGFMFWHLMGADKREACGAEGRRWSLNEGGLNSKNMGEQFITAMDYVFKNWVRPKKFGVYTVKDYVGNKMPNGQLGFEIPKINKDALLEKIQKVTI